MAYNPTKFVNDSTPPISAENLNKMEAGITNSSAAIDSISENIYSSNQISETATANGWVLNDNGLCSSNQSYKLVKFVCTAGVSYRIKTNYKFQFQNSASVPSSGSSNRIGLTYSAGEYVIDAPTGATYIIVCTTVSSSLATVETLYSNIGKTDSAIGMNYYNLISVYNGSSNNSGNTNVICTGGTGNDSKNGLIRVYPGDVIDIAITKSLPNNTDYYTFGFSLYSTNTSPFNRVRNVDYSATNKKENVFPIVVESGENYLGITIAAYDSGGNVIQLRNTNYTINDFVVFNKKESPFVEIENTLENLNVKPVLRNGSMGNYSNTRAISTNYIFPTNDADYVVFDCDLNFVYGLYTAVRFYSVYTEKQLSSDTTNRVGEIEPAYIEKKGNNHFLLPVKGYAAFALALWDYDGTNFNDLRIENVGNCLSFQYLYDSDAKEESRRYTKMSRHTNNPLTLLHFSDIHEDKNALERISNYGTELKEFIDDIICTGDIVANTYSNITSWWKESILTCVGNHDSASYNSQTGYNWTALSMADRDAYYIAPFESNWGITHTSGKSYYYKDYSDAKVRLIVMDVMLYMSDSTSTEAATQTSWLEDLLADAITNNLHCLIAIHCPHGGSEPFVCSFTKLNETTMPVHGDCDTKDVIISTVASAIEGGLKFIGYLVGHTHQDDIWKATEDGSQLMYCVTCANVWVSGQWKTSDQFRDETMDAFNLVTIDTTNTLVKIIRGGGANIDKYMRPRQAITFNYSTGEKVAEIL